jgi:hypothetical protein
MYIYAQKLQIKKVYLCGHHSQPQSKLPSSSDVARQTKPFELLVLGHYSSLPKKKNNPRDLCVILLLIYSLTSQVPILINIVI